MRNNAKQAAVHCTFMATWVMGCLKVKLLPVVHEQLTKQNFLKVTDMASDTLSTPRYIGTTYLAVAY